MFRFVIACFMFVCFVSCLQESSKSLANSSPDAPSSPELIDTSMINMIMGHFNPEKEEDFEVISKTYADREGLYMRKEAYRAFRDMYEAALKDGISLVIVSATRNFDYQKTIWEKKWTGKTILSSGENAATDFANDSLRARKILEYSSMPGTSRHHWGTDVDFNKLDNGWFESGEGLRLFQWLESNAERFGFCRPYTQKDIDRPEGYNEEKWHWSYSPLSEELTAYAAQYLNDSMIKKFQGAEAASSIEVVQNYVLGIHHSCKN